MPPQRTVRAAITLILLASLAACTIVPAPGSAAPLGSPSASSAAALLDGLTVATPASMRGYSRAKFPTWRKTGENCDVRDSVLRRDGTHVKTSGCNVVAGTWISPYDGKVLNSPTKVDIDHLVPLADAWRSGASSWSTGKREDFANDLGHPQLAAVSITANRAKGDQDPSTWKPPRRDAWCTYATDWITVKAAWKLTVTSAEKSALGKMLETC